MTTKEGIANTPTSVQIGPFVYGISFDADESFEWDRMGSCHNRTRRIVLNPQQADTEIRQTLLHEMLHAIGCIYEIAMVDHHWKGEEEHLDKIDLLTTALRELFRNNPGLAAWLAA